MSRLTELIARARAKDAALGEELEKEFKALSSRRAFGLNFERHKPESVELPGRPVRKGDKVRVLPPRGTTIKGDQTLFKVLKITKKEDERIAELSQLDVEEPEVKEVAVDDLVVVAEFRDYIYPGLISTGKVERGGAKPFHSVINGENFHVLEALTYAHRGQVDAIYIDPPYNSGAKDWKYNNDYVESEDLYRHSKWLAFIERRLLVAKELLNPKSSALAVTIDEKEYLRLGLLLEQIFPEAKIQMVSSVINPKGVIRANELTRTNEFIFFVIIGEQKLVPEVLESEKQEVRWASLRRFEISSRRHGPTPRLGQFYPVYVDIKSGNIRKVGTPLDLHESRHDVPDLDGCITLFPIKPDGTEMIWGLTADTMENRWKNGYVKVQKSKGKSPTFTLYYLTSGQIEDLNEGKLIVDGHAEDGSVNVSYVQGKASLRSTHWTKESHNAQSHGSNLLKAILPGRSFPFPKSLYAVEDVLRILVGNNKEALILDFFAGSGTTLHAVMRLNKQDDGNRKCIIITNNEVAADEQSKLRKEKLRPGDQDWEQWGICDHITKPRIRAVITGQTPEGKCIEGDYKYIDEFPIADGFEENAEFFTLTYETPVAVRHNLAFKRIGPLLWMRAGSKGSRIEKILEQGWDVVDTYGLVVNLDESTKFCKAVKARKSVRIANIVTDDDRRFQAVARHLPDSVEPVRLYESYLSNFRFSMGR